MSKPFIGILAGILSPGTKSQSVKRYFANYSYVNAVSKNGGTPIILPDTESLSLCDGIIFPGGPDVDPELYNEQPHRELGQVNRVNDDFWIEAASFAVSHKVPVLGICRGLQLLNVFCGGTLYQDIKSERQGSINHTQESARSALSHKVNINEDSRLYKILGEKVISVNSLHHQAIKSCAGNLNVSAHAIEDGVIEGVESPDGLIMAVQWHPEELIENVPVMNKLFADLIQRACNNNN